MKTSSPLNKMIFLEQKFRGHLSHHFVNRRSYLLEVKSVRKKAVCLQFNFVCFIRYDELSKYLTSFKFVTLNECELEL